MPPPGLKPGVREQVQPLRMRRRESADLQNISPHTWGKHEMSRQLDCLRLFLIL